jgi:hypothetical protein
MAHSGAHPEDAEHPADFADTVRQGQRTGKEATVKTGLTINELSAKVQLDKANTRDFVVPTRELRYLAPRQDAPNGSLLFDFKEAAFEAAPTDHAFGQILLHAGIPAKYAERMRTDAPALLAQNVGHWLQADNAQRLVRTLHNGKTLARAFLSDRYRPIDNVDMLEAMLPAILAADCEIKSADITETRLYIQAVSKKITGIIQPSRHERVAKGDDEIQPGIVITNSEVGMGAFKIESMFYRLACYNGCILGTAMRRAHLGRLLGGNGDDGEDVREFLTDETRSASDKALYLQARDTVAGMLDELRFKKLVDKLNHAASVELGDDLPHIAEVTAKQLALTEGEKNSILTHLAKGGDLTKWGLLNAVTRTAEDAPSYDRAIELERFGSQVLAIPTEAFVKPSKN